MQSLSSEFSGIHMYSTHKYLPEFRRRLKVYCILRYTVYHALFCIHPDLRRKTNYKEAHSIRIICFYFFL